MLKISILHIFIFLILADNSFAQNNYVSDELIAKFTSIEQIKAFGQKAQNEFGVLSIKRIFPSKPYELQDELDKSIAKIYTIKLERNSLLLKVKERLLSLGYFEYVEPRYIGKLAYSPNDPGFGNQYALNLIQAEKAWDLSRGNANVLIGLVDAGIDTTHIDLKGKFYNNISDPINGIDDDNDGYIDNYWGWDFKTNSGSSFYTGSVDHGTQMSGVISPNTNNGIDIAGIAYACKILGVKVTNGSQVLYGYEGIKYAADKGCKVINCSWNIKSYAQFGEEMVDYATQRGALVVAAMGNQGREDLNYPAMYNQVLAVANTDLNDNRVSSSNIGYYADISAPGINVITTKGKTGLIRNSGTSFSSAFVSGSAALLASYNPALSPQDLKYFLKASATKIYENGKNSFYKNKLGVGRLSVYDAITHTGSWLTIDSISFADIYGGLAEQSDTIEVYSWVISYLDNSNGGRVLLRDLSGHAQVLDSIWMAPPTLKDKKNTNKNSPFRVKMNPIIPQDEDLEFELEIQTQSDTHTTGFKIPVNPSYRNLMTNNLHTTIGSRGTFGYYEYPQKKGIGVTYRGSKQLLYEGGLIIGQGVEGSSIVVDRIRGIRDVEQTDFRTTVGLQELNTSANDLEYHSQFDDQNALKPIHISIDQYAYANNDVGRENYVVIDYIIKSSQNEKLENIYVGMFADWDLLDAEKNSAKYNGQRYLAYTYSETDLVPYVGVQLLTNYDNWHCYSIDHVFGGEGGIDLTDNDVFSKEEKFYALTHFRENAGGQAGGADVLQLLSTGPHTIQKNDSLTISFAIHGADNLEQLFANSDTAFFRKNGKLPMQIIEKNEPKMQVFPNPSNGKIAIKTSSQYQQGIYSIKVFDYSGKTVLKKRWVENLNHKVEIDLTRLQNGLYFVEIHDFEGNVFREKIIKKNVNPVYPISYSPFFEQD